MKEGHDNSQFEQTMLKVAGKPFRCKCGCNVFTKRPDHGEGRGFMEEDGYIYVCNSCNAKYQGGMK